MKTSHDTSHGITIKTQGKQNRFTINGNIYNGVQDLLFQKVEVIADMSYKFDVYVDKFGNYVLRKCEPYPCFDSSDRMHENRFYRSYMICSSKEEVMDKYNYIIGHNPDCLAGKYTPAFLAPLIYADDGAEKICIMITSNKNIANSK